MFRAVIFDWRGTLVTTLTDHAWVQAALVRLHRDTHSAQVDKLVAAIRAASGEPDRLEGPGVDSDAGLHRRTYLRVLRDAGLDEAAGDLVRERVQAGAEDVHFPQAFVRAVLAEFTGPGDVVLDPFAGYGTTLVVAEQMDRVGVGVELLAERVALARTRLHGSGRIIEGDARNLARFGIGPVDLCLTSPPYMSAVDHPENPLTAYRTRDGDYAKYLDELGQVFAAVARLLRPGGHLVINAATIRTGHVVTPLAWDMARVAGRHLVFNGETYLWWDEQASWVSGDYCLRFQKPA